MNSNSVIFTNILQGFGTGAIYVPLAAIAFATLPAQMRNEGTALFNLLRNIGSAIGISTVQGLLVYNTQVVHASLVEHLTPRMLSQHLGAFSGEHGADLLNGMVTTQATMIAYLDDFHLLLVLTIVTAFALLLVRKPKSGIQAPDNVVLE
jgi:DHA2 family multidrug resistance protein